MLLKLVKKKGGNINTASTIKKVPIQSLVTKENIEVSWKYLKSWKMDLEKALGLFYSSKMTKNSYIIAWNSAKIDGCNYYRSYNKIREAFLNILHLLLQKLKQ